MNGKFAKWSLIQLLTIIMIFAAGSVFAAGEALIHNSQTTGSTKWGGSWGVAGGQYGEFTCTTCHSSGTTGPNGNIKKVVAAIPDTIGPNVNKLVTFNNLTGFGDDSASHATSTKICEVCHTQTTAHQYNTANAPQSGDLTHANGDCTQCHLHADGFKASGHLVPLYATSAGHTGCASGIGCHTNSSNPAAPYPATGSPVTPPDCRTCHAKADPLTVGIGCGSCHGVAGGNGMPSGAKEDTAFPNWSGSHSVHVAKAACTECHTSGGTGGNADHGRGNRDTNPAVVNLNATYGWTGTTCNTASCHANPYVVDAYVAAPAWGTKNNGCTACHSANPIGANGPATGNHTNVPGHAVACINCHATGTTATTSATLANGHADGNIDVLNVGYPADKTKGIAGATCLSASCHANVYGTGNVTTPAWGATPNGSCTVCHNTQPITASGPATGSHAKHAAKAVACTSCHAAGTTATTAPSAANGHYDGDIDITYSGYPTNKTKGSVYGTCNNVACHTPNTTTPSNSLTWGVAATCNTCHPKTSLSGAHQVHMGALDLSSASILYNMTANRTPVAAQVSETDRKHGFGCAECHPMDPANHLNGAINVDLNRVGVAGVGSLRFLNASSASYDMASTKKCSNIYCHSNASRIEIESNVGSNTSLAWTDTFAAHPTTDRCAYCHGNQPTTGAHAAHSVGIHTFNEGPASILEGNVYNGKSGKVLITNKPNTAHGNPNNSTTLSCYICHNATVTSKANDKNDRCYRCHIDGLYNASQKGLAAIANLKNHVNGNREIAFLPIQVLSKAQIRPKGPLNPAALDPRTTFDFYSGMWTRNTYKNMSTLSFDTAKIALNTATMWHYSSAKQSSCSNIACHNGNLVKWNLANFNDPNKCMDCHNAL